MIPEPQRTYILELVAALGPAAKDFVIAGAQAIWGRDSAFPRARNCSIFAKTKRFHFPRCKWWTQIRTSRNRFQRLNFT
jgi:hypothetical protein